MALELRFPFDLTASAPGGIRTPTISNFRKVQLYPLSYRRVKWLPEKLISLEENKKFDDH